MPTPKAERTCRKKRCYQSLKEAHFAALSLRAKNFELSQWPDRFLNGYACRVCKQFHIGHGQLSPKMYGDIRAIEEEYEREVGEIKAKTLYLD